MATMTSFCRITGHARNLPKPCYFPLLPPISPADAKKLCRITGKATDHHNYSPIIAFGKPIKFDGIVGCRITMNENFNYHILAPLKHKENDRNIQYYKEFVTKVNSKKKRLTDIHKFYVYDVQDQNKSIIIPPELEEAIRTGEVDAVSLSKDDNHITVKIKLGRLIKISMECLPKEKLSELDNLHYGEGQCNGVIEDQQRILEERKKRKQETMAKRKLFEDKEKKAEEEDIKSRERPKSKRPRVVFDPKKRQEKRQKLENMLIEEKENKAILPPKVDLTSRSDPDEQLRYQRMFSDVKTAQAFAVKLNFFGSADFNYCEVEKSEKAGFDWNDFPHEEVIEPIEVKTCSHNPSVIISTNEIQPLDIVASVETVEPVAMINPQIAEGITGLKKKKLKTTENVASTLAEMNSNNLIPSLAQINKVVESTSSELSHGYLVETENTSEFILKEKYVPGKEKAISGVMVAIENELKFVSGQIIKLAEQESFVAGQTIETSEGSRFIPGQTIINQVGNITFMPGTVGSDYNNRPSFVSGRVVEAVDGPKFIAGQMVDRGDGKPVFTSGQTVTTEDGPKFVPGEVISDGEGDHEFIPGITIIINEGEKFIPGQVFQSQEGLCMTPGQIIETYEGPSFIPGSSFKTSTGDQKFVQGNTVEMEDGKIKFERRKPDVPIIKEDLLIPNKDLHLVADPHREVIGFTVRPSNTSNLQKGERLYGDIVEMEDAVLFYLTGKLPENKDHEAKIISGELRVGDKSQRFIPGKKLGSPDGEKFVPGQVVVTNHGEEFVPGQIIETGDGPKFVPGQVIMTSDGEKFVPGQVIIHDDGPKFVPGQIIQTENGATFIPGQMMNTDVGRKFVPGQLVDTKEGPMFVPGQVVETSDGPKFVPGIIVETEEGLKYVPSEADDQEDDVEFTFQGFDITPEELILLSNAVDDSNRHSPVTGEHGLIDASTLKKLACNNMVIHGRTPEPLTEKKKKHKRKMIVGFDTPYEDEDEVEPEDSDIEKVEILKGLLKAESTMSNVKKERELRKILDIIGYETENGEQAAGIHAINYILSTTINNGDIFKLFIGNDDRIVTEILSGIGNLNNIERNDQVKKLVHNALRSIVTKKCNKQVNELVDTLSMNPDNLFSEPRSQILLTEAVGIVCITGDVEAATLLEKFISEPTDPNCLREDKDILAVLRQLLVLHEIAKRDQDVADILHELRSDPEGMKSRSKVHALIKKAKSLLREEEEQFRPFDIRHVASSKDIPTELFEQLKEDKEEAEKFIENLPDQLFYAIMGDERCGEKLLDSLDSAKMSRTMRELQKFKKGMAVVVTKENMQAVIPRHFARSVYYGIMPYILIDEEGFKFFERGLTGRKLAPSKVIENTWYDEDYYKNNVLFPQRVVYPGQQYSVMLLGQNYDINAPSLQYTSLLPTSGPTRLSYSEAFRRSSREATPLRISSGSGTPSRRSSAASYIDPYGPTKLDSYSRRSSLASQPYAIPRAMSPMNTSTTEEEDYTGTSVHNAVVPYVAEEENESTPVARSDTVANLLDKYTNFSVEKEFEKPLAPSSKYTRQDPLYLEDSDEDDEYPMKERKRFPLGGNTRRSLLSPERTQKDSLQNGFGNRGKDKNMTDDSYMRENRKLRRPFSDIYEVDELESPTVEKSSCLNKPNLTGRKVSSRRYKQLEDDLDNGFVPFPSRNRYSISPLSDIDELSYSKYPKRKGMRITEADYDMNKLGLYHDDEFNDRRRRRRSEPSHAGKYISDVNPYSGQYGTSLPIGSRSVDRDFSPARRRFHGEDPKSDKTSRKPKSRRYKHIEDPGDSVYTPQYNIENSYTSSSYLNPYESLAVDEDLEERPSYQLLGKRYQSPLNTHGHRNLGGYSGSYVSGHNYSRPIPNYENILPGRYGGYDSSSNTGMPYGGVAPYGGGYRAPQSPQISNYGVGYRTPQNNILPNYGTGLQTSPNITSSSYGLGSRLPPNPAFSTYGAGGRLSTNLSPQDYGTGANRMQYPDDDTDLPKLNLPKLKKFDASKYLNDDDVGDDDIDGVVDINRNDMAEAVCDGDYEPKFEQRKLASVLAKKYLRNFSDDEGEEDE